MALTVQLSACLVLLPSAPAIILKPAASKALSRLQADIHQVAVGTGRSHVVEKLKRFVAGSRALTLTGAAHGTGILSAGATAASWRQCDGGAGGLLQ